VSESTDTTPRPIRAATDQSAFLSDQRALARQWHFVGFLEDVANEGDWIRSRLGAEQIFVQRFDTGLRGFVNRCAHRHHPIRSGDRGNGPVVCPFHQWRYDRDGLAYGIPKCLEVFGKSARELDARLRPVEVETIGLFVFGRVGDGPDLADWLGPGREVLEHLGNAKALRPRIDRQVKAHWSFLMQISLDDYHLAGVHPTTFGKNGYLDTKTLRYVRFSAHSAYFSSMDEGVFDHFIEACRAGKWNTQGYKIFQFFPHLIVVVSQAPTILGKTVSVIIVQHLEPLAHNLTRSRMRFFAMGDLDDLKARTILPFVSAGAWLTARRIHDEDNACCEQLQDVAEGVDTPPLISAQETRISWFDEDYARMTTVTSDAPGGR
jgi:phenylpropionate dioxygenase-like ring-hydroxylating dioxygenase large terminal subunit